LACRSRAKWKIPDANGRVLRANRHTLADQLDPTAKRAAEWCNAPRGDGLHASKPAISLAAPVVWGAFLHFAAMLAMGISATLLSEGQVMQIRWVLIAIAFATLAGCAVPGPRGERTESKLTCDGAKKCEVNVAVDCTAGGCELSVDHQLIVVIDKRKDDITWTLPGSSEFSFAENGIVFPDSAEFGCKSDGPRRFVCSNRHSKFGAWKYAIRLTGPRTVPVLDPWVIND